MTNQDGEVVEGSEQESKAHYRAVSLAVFVTVLWASSWVIIKFGLEEIPPLTFSGLRYTVAAVILLGVIFSNSDYRASVGKQTRRWWIVITAYGLIFVSITQGAQFVGLFYLEAITVTMLLNLTPIFVLVFGSILIRETPAPNQIAWILLGVAGAMLYFYPVDLPLDQMFGLMVVLVGVIANALSSIIGRDINRRKTAPSVVVTGMSMTIGAIVLLAAGLILEDLVVLSPLSIVYILWLSVVNTAFAFTLWNKAMQTLRAIDTTIINSLMMPQIIVLAYIFLPLERTQTPLDWFALFIVGISVFLVQFSQGRKLAKGETKTSSVTES